MSDLQSMLEWIGGASMQLLVAAALAWLLCVTVARKSPALRHAIWVVVLLKCFVPPSVTAPWSLSQLWVSPAVGQAPPDAAASNLEQQIDRATVLRTVPEEVNRSETPGQSGDVARHGSQSRGTGVDAIGNTVTRTPQTILDQPVPSESFDDPVAPERQARPDLRERSSRNITAAEAFRRWWIGTLSTASLMFVWVGGSIVALALAALSIVRVSAKVRRGEQIDEGPAAIAVEEAALKLGLKSPPKLVATDDAVTPFVAGLFRPTVVIPRSILESLPADELRLVVWHEVVHVARRDAWTSLLQLSSVAAFWFHPAVWWAAAAVRREREACCDETVLRTTQAEPSTYGDAFLHVLSAVRGRAIAAPAWAAPAGVFERDSDLRSRIEQIMSFRPTPSKRVTVGLVATLFALAVVPMGVRANGPWAGVAESDIPSIVSISPSIGATDVDPEIGEIKVTFDRPMDSGFSWTGSGPTYPPTPDGRKPSWSNDRTTCTLPVDLQAGQFYRVGINSKSYQNFRSPDGVPVKPAVLTFTTRGANAAAVGRMDAPKIVAIDPPNGATDVHPLTTKEIRVTFDRPMGDGMSWVGGGETFPVSPDGEEPKWLSNSRTCVFPVALDANHSYALSLNSDRHKNFQSSSGVPLEPFSYAFTTESESAAAVILSDSFEKPHRHKMFAEYHGLLRTKADAVTGEHSIKLLNLDPAPNVTVRQPTGDFDFVQSGTAYTYGDPFPIPNWATELKISAMIKAEQVQDASINVGFMKLTPSARAGKENSYFTVPPVDADPADEDAVESIFIGRLADDEPAAHHGWALYERTVVVPEHAELIDVSIELASGEALWVDDVQILAASDPRVREVRELSAVPTDSKTLARIEELIHEVETNLAEARTHYGESHPTVVRLNKQLAVLAKKKDEISVRSVPENRRAMEIELRNLEQTLEEKLLDYGPSHPDVERVRHSLDELRKAYQDNLDRQLADPTDAKPVDQTTPDLRASDVRGGVPIRPPSISTTLFDVHDSEGLLFKDDFTWSGLEPSLWKRQNVTGVVLKHRTDVGNQTATLSRSLEMRKSVYSYFPIASWSRRVEHSDPNATHVQVRAYVKAEQARKAVLDVLFLDEAGEWIRHQWVDYIGDERLQWGVGEGRHFQNGDLKPGEPGVTHTWYPYGGAVAIPEGTKHIEVSAQMYGPGTVFIDDVEVRYVTPNS